MTSSTKRNFPKTLGKYELIDRIGDGGMAEVFRARLPGAAGFEKVVVIKRILPHLIRRKQVVEMFVAEAKLTAEAQHKNIVQVFELVEGDDGEFFMVMELVNGTDLRQLLKSAARRSFRVPPWFSVHLMVEVLEALSYVHELTDAAGRPRGIIHRDVSPSNIFISHAGEVKLGDFGIAKEPNQSSKTQVGQLKGKVPYMSPEQILGERIDQRADVFAAGIVLWECLAQRRLFGGRSDLSAMRMIIGDERRAPSDCVPDIHPELDRVVLEALSADPQKRTPTARELQSRLLDVLPKLARTVRPVEVRRVVEVLLGKKPRAESSEVSVMMIDTGHNFAGEDASVDDDATPSKVEPPPEARPAGELGPATDLDLSFEHGMVEHQSGGARRPSLTKVAREAGSVSTSNPRFSSEAPPAREPAETGAEEVPDWLVTGPNMHARVHPEISSRAGGFGAQRWALEASQKDRYDGPHPFWLRTRGGDELGPVSAERTLELIKAEANVRLGRDATVSADRLTYVELGTFCALAGCEGLLYDETERHLVERPGTTLGHLDERNMTTVLAWLGHERLTGKLTVSPDGAKRAVLREVHVIGGQPVYTFANETSLQLPEVLVAKKVLQRRQLPELLHEALRKRRSLDDVVAERSNGAKYRVMLMKERMVEVLRWRSGRFVFDPEGKLEAGQPFARSLVSLIPELTHRAFSTEELRTTLAAVMNRKLEAAKELERAMEELTFTEVQKETARALAKGRKAASLAKVRPEEEKIQLLVVHVLLELGLLTPV